MNDFSGAVAAALRPARTAAPHGPGGRLLPGHVANGRTAGLITLPRWSTGTRRPGEAAYEMSHKA